MAEVRGGQSSGSTGAATFAFGGDGLSLLPQRGHGLARASGALTGAPPDQDLPCAAAQGRWSSPRAWATPPIHVGRSQHVRVVTVPPSCWLAAGAYYARRRAGLVVRATGGRVPLAELSGPTADNRYQAPVAGRALGHA